MVGIISIFLLVFAAGFFVAGEFSIVSVRQTRIEQLISEGSTVARSVKKALEHLDRYIAAVQIGITIATLALGGLGEPLLAETIRPWLEGVMPANEAFVSSHAVAGTLAFLFVTVVEIVLGEIVPKMIARQNAEATAMLLIRPLNFFVLIFRPLIWIVSLLSNGVMRLIGLRGDIAHTNVHSVEELEMLVVSSRKAGVLDREEEVILRRVFDFGDLTARQVMRPRTEIVALSVTDSFQEVISLMVEHRHSRFPVYEGDLDNIVGVVHVKDVFAAMAQGMVRDLEGVTGTLAERQAGAQISTRSQSDSSGQGLALVDVRSLMRPIPAVPETLDVDQLLTRMQGSGMHIAVVVDEYGGTAGMVTLEDVVEEIVGEVRDEFDPGDDRPGIEFTPEGILIDGLMAISDVNEALGLEIESGADTMGGYVFQALGRKPEIDDHVEGSGYTFRVEELDGLRIAKVKALAGPRRREEVVNDDEE
ncbi:MAG: hemolysin family protein [Chloroflexota bacterium]|nr:hemolysin family protein [Chloroflexota bacterium]